MIPKFRVWGVIPGRIMIVHDLGWDAETGNLVGGACWDEKDCYWDFDIKPSVVLMQSTGLKDKNDVEIFDGDIVKAIFSLLQTRVVGPIYFSNAGFTLIDRWIINFKDFEVIGNIYQNPELLKQEVKDE